MIRLQVTLRTGYRYDVEVSHCDTAADALEYLLRDCTTYPTTNGGAIVTDQIASVDALPPRYR